jgi:UDP-N-acetylglucosamine acyltransferase
MSSAATAPTVHPTAVVDPRARLSGGVEIGPYAVIGPEVQIGEGTRIGPHVVIDGRVRLGRDNRIFPGACIGLEPQDLKYGGAPTEVVIGDGNTIRECVTINRATTKEEGLTTVGDRCYLMACCHVAHDCRIGDRVVIANGTLLGGHVHVHNDAIFSGGVGVHHFATVGSFAFVSGLSRVLHDVPPFMLVEGSPARPRCINVVALKRNQFPAETIEALAEAHRLLYRAKVGLDHAREILRGNGRLLPAVNHLISFVEEQHEGRHGRGRERRRAA